MLASFSSPPKPVFPRTNIMCGPCKINHDGSLVMVVLHWLVCRQLPAWTGFWHWQPYPGLFQSCLQHQVVLRLSWIKGMCQPRAFHCSWQFCGSQFCLSSFCGNETSGLQPASSMLTPPRHISSRTVPVGSTFLTFTIVLLQS